MNMAMIYEKLKNLEASLNNLNIASDIDPENQKVHILKQRLEQIIIGVTNGVISEEQVYEQAPQ